MRSDEIAEGAVAAEATPTRDAPIDPPAVPGASTATAAMGRTFHGIVAAALAAVFVLSFAGVDRWVAAQAAPGDESVRTLCALRLLTGIPCPSCGLTRSFCSIGRGEPVAAVEFHALGPVVFALFAFLLVRSAGIAIRGRSWLDGSAQRLVRAIPILVTVGIVAWIVRLSIMLASGAAAAAWHASVGGRIF
jgi:hypothetical protein